MLPRAIVTVMSDAQRLCHTQSAHDVQGAQSRSRGYLTGVLPRLPKTGDTDCPHDARAGLARPCGCDISNMQHIILPKSFTAGIADL